jgi:hypothetical protein
VSGAKRLDRRRWLDAVRHLTRRDGAVLWALLLLPWIVALVLWLLCLLWRSHPHLDVGVVIFGLAAVSIGLPTLWVTWAAYRGRGDKEIAREIITQLEYRRVLFGERHSGDEQFCVASANEIREILTTQISAAKPGKDLEDSLRNMRAACLKFVDAAGPNAENFHPGWPQNSHFVISLGDLRTLMGVQIARIVTQFDLPVEKELASILPPTDEEDQE